MKTLEDFKNALQKTIVHLEDLLTKEDYQLVDKNGLEEKSPTESLLNILKDLLVQLNEVQGDTTSHDSSIKPKKSEQINNFLEKIKQEYSQVAIINEMLLEPLQITQDTQPEAIQKIVNQRLFVPKFSVVAHQDSFFQPSREIPPSGSSSLQISDMHPTQARSLLGYIANNFLNAVEDFLEVLTTEASEEAPGSNYII